MSRARMFRPSPVFDECRVEIRRMFAGEITGEELARRAMEIGRKYGLDDNWLTMRLGQDRGDSDHGQAS